MRPWDRLGRELLKRLGICQKLVGNLFEDDESLRSHPALAGIVHATPNSPFDRFIEFCVF